MSRSGCHTIFYVAEEPRCLSPAQRVLERGGIPHQRLSLTTFSGRRRGRQGACRGASRRKQTPSNNRREFALLSRSLALGQDSTSNILAKCQQFCAGQSFCVLNIKTHIDGLVLAAGLISFYLIQ